MKHVIRNVLLAGLVGTFVLASGCDRSRGEATASQSSASTGSTAGGAVDGAEARRLLAEDDAVLVDVRTPEEYAGGHVAEAINIPVQEIEGRMSELSRDRPVIVYCHSGRRSSAAASALRDAGYTAYDLGPMSAWGG